ncbi:MAG: carboxylating nicotinate-nucleotide diphosphorylase [Candidatus Ranarchaeia archaeon]|jgi:nicotinate-nucleotide pyrophosphorylase (carboxylating)
MMTLPTDWEEIIQKALLEDKFKDDITTNAIVSEDISTTAKIFSREKGIIAGLALVKKIFTYPPSDVVFKNLVEDGDQVTLDQEIAELHGNARVIITRERVALNFLQHLSGIATYTQKFVDLANQVKILDTRKTIPTLRELQKYAVRLGGGVNHRMNLSEMILIKDNHIALAGSITNAVKKVRMQSDKPIEVETKTLDEVKEAIKLDPDRIMLDNMDVEKIEKALELIDNKIEVEVSGTVGLEDITRLAKLRIHYISIGRLTHSAPALDISLEILLLEKNKK